MTPADGVVYQKDLAGTKTPLRSVTNLDLTLTGQVDHVLAPRRHMPLVDVAGWRVTENDAISRLERSDLHLDFFKVRFAVRSSIDSRDFHDDALLWLVGEFSSIASKAKGCFTTVRLKQ